MSGGGIDNLGALTLTDCTVTRNEAQDGGGIFNEAPGSLLATDCTISDNFVADTAIGVGAGIANVGTLRASNCILTANNAFSGSGGAIENVNAASLTQCTVTSNSAGFGGGINNIGTLSLTGCDIASNIAESKGGGVANFSPISLFDGTVTAVDCTIANNSGFGGAGRGWD